MITQYKCLKECFIFNSANEDLNMMLIKGAIYDLHRVDDGYTISHLGGSQIWISTSNFDLLLKHQIFA